MKDKENIFKRFISFIKRIFENEEPKQISAKSKETEKQESKSNFIEVLKSYKVEEEDPALLKLQDQYEKSEIDLCVMSNEQIHDLNSLYKRQVSELKEKLIKKKRELSIIQQRISNNSANM